MHNILVCDDDRDIVAALKIYLSGGEYRVFEAYNGAEAVELHLYGDRARIRETATLHALDLLRRKCLNRTFVRDIL